MKAMALGGNEDHHGNCDGDEGPLGTEETGVMVAEDAVDRLKKEGRYSLTLTPISCIFPRILV